ncbi:MAG: long-chain fatty acid--CoA ligase [Rhodomicrobium sp.]
MEGKAPPGADRSKPFISAPRRFLQMAARRGEAPAYYVRGTEGWTPTSWAAFGEEVRQAARALVALGVKPGDAVAVLGYNRAEWVVMDVAAMMIGASVAGIYFTASAHDAAYIINHAQCEIALAEKEEHFQRIASERAQLNALRHVVMMKGEVASDPLQMTWETFLSYGEKSFDPEVERRSQAIEPADAGCLIYTSGTTGTPKAVQLSHGALTETAGLIRQLWEVSEEDCIISYLPLAHIAERMISVHFPLTVGSAVYFVPDILKLGDFLKEVRPHLFFGVPRVFEKIVAAAQLQIVNAKGVKGKIARWAVRTGQAWHEKEQAGQRIGVKTALAKAVASALVHKKAKAAMGFDRARYVACGAAPISEETLRFMMGLDIPVRELWGMSETCGAGTTNLPGATKLGSVGRAHPGLDLKIGPDGEILVRGPYIFSGYARDADATAKALEGGWLHTGDLGSLDEDGYLTITGRKKDIIITAGGKNVAPANLEMELAALPLVEHAIVCGDRRPYLSALLTLNAAAADHFAAERGLKANSPQHEAAIRQELQKGIDAINERHARVENIRRFTILPEPLSIKGGDLTPTMKVKRAVVIKKLEPTIDRLYE